MTDHTTTVTPPNAPDQKRPSRRGGLRRYALIAALIAASGLTGAAASQAFGAGDGFGMWHGRGFMGGRMGHKLDPAQIEQRLDRRVRHFAVDVDATPEQTERLRAVARSALRDLLPLREKAFDGSRERFLSLLTQPTIDRSAIEALRAEKVATLDQVSKRVAQAFADAAEILTPEQRKAVAERWATRGHPGFGHGRRHDRMMP